MAVVKAVNGADSEDDVASKQYVETILRFCPFDIGLSLRSTLVNTGHCLPWKNVAVAANRTTLSNVAGETISMNASRNLPL